jgi:hypothetical protein
LATLGGYTTVNLTFDRIFKLAGIGCSLFNGTRDPFKQCKQGFFSGFVHVQPPFLGS